MEFSAILQWIPPDMLSYLDGFNRIPIQLMAIFMGIIIVLIRLVQFSVRENRTYEITINQSKKVRVRSGDYLSKALFHHDIFIPSACGGKGSCSACKVKMVHPMGEALPTDQAALGVDEIKDGYRLGCQRKVRDDLSIRIPDDLFFVSRFSGHVTDTIRLTCDIRRLLISIHTPSKGITFKNGQYISILLDNGEERAYSIASSNTERHFIEIEVKKASADGASALLHRLRKGDGLNFTGPFGDFYLRKSHHDILCVAGGVGIAPIKPIIDETLRKSPQRKIILFYGAKYIEELYNHVYFKELDTQHTQFCYVPILSREKKNDLKDTISRGAIHDVLHRRMGETLSSDAYVCGPPGMVDSVIRILEKKHIPKKRIFYEKF